MCTLLTTPNQEENRSSEKHFRFLIQCFSPLFGCVWSNQPINGPFDVCPVNELRAAIKAPLIYSWCKALWLSLHCLPWPPINANEHIGVFPKFMTLKGLEPATSCVRDQDATTAPARHMWETGSLNWAQFMLQWFINFTEFTEFSKSSAPFRKNSNVFTDVSLSIERQHQRPVLVNGDAYKISPRTIPKRHHWPVLETECGETLRHWSFTSPIPKLI